MFGQWDPRNQRPEPWSIYNTKLRKGEHFRVFPLSNWTEVDIWSYIEREGLTLPSIYFAHEREVFMRDGLFMAADEVVERLPGEEVFTETVRFRTVGDMTCTGALKSTASTVQDVLVETRASDVSERGASRADDRTSEAAMEDRKRGGYF
jgi:sulfate adenylyltransferase subunit 2